MEAGEESLTAPYRGDQKNWEAHVLFWADDCVGDPQVLCVDDTEVRRVVHLGYPEGDGQRRVEAHKIRMGGDEKAPGRDEAVLHVASWRRVGQDKEVPGRAEKVHGQGLGGDQGPREMALGCDHRATPKGDSGGCEFSDEDGKVDMEVPHRSPPKVYGGGSEILLAGHRQNCKMGLGHCHCSGSQSVSNGLPRHHRCSRNILGVVREYAWGTRIPSAHIRFFPLAAVHVGKCGPGHQADTQLLFCLCSRSYLGRDQGHVQALL